jgi:hypothetical protein
MFDPILISPINFLAAYVVGSLLGKIGITLGKLVYKK